MEYYSAIERNNLLTCARTRMHFKCFALRSQFPKFLCDSSLYDTLERAQEKGRVPAESTKQQTKHRQQALAYCWVEVGLVAQWCPGILWTVAHQASLSMLFPRQESWSGCHSLLQGIFLTQGLNPGLLHISCIAGGFFTAWATREGGEMQRNSLLRAESFTSDAFWKMFKGSR